MDKQSVAERTEALRTNARRLAFSITTEYNGNGTPRYRVIRDGQLTRSRFHRLADALAFIESACR